MRLAQSATLPSLPLYLISFGRRSLVSASKMGLSPVLMSIHGLLQDRCYHEPTYPVLRKVWFIDDVRLAFVLFLKDEALN